jgi:hypothetical protein
MGDLAGRTGDGGGLSAGGALKLTALARTAITQAAYDAICATLPLGSVAVEPELNERGERLMWLEDAMVDPLFPPSATVFCSARRG